RGRVVVTQDRAHHLRRVAQVEVAAAEIARRGQRRVVQVLYVRLAVTVAVGGVARPRARQELHRPQCPRVGGATGLHALDDDLVAGQGAVERRPVDGADRGTARVGGTAVGV